MFEMPERRQAPALVRGAREEGYRVPVRRMRCVSWETNMSRRRRCTCRRPLESPCECFDVPAVYECRICGMMFGEDESSPEEDDMCHGCGEETLDARALVDELCIGFIELGNALGGK